MYYMLCNEGGHLKKKLISVRGKSKQTKKIKKLNEHEETKLSHSLFFGEGTINIIVRKN